MTLIPSYPIFLWITWCKILFIVSDQNWKSFFPRFTVQPKSKKNHYKSLDCYSYPQTVKLTVRCE
ncbi:hypothetical protein FOC35_12620 [Cedecea sp. FDAARGOS_727]|nr:hypothetical protein FOC35_12620 [Cedecea sp. FDAARGOS_727]